MLVIMLVSLSSLVIVLINNSELEFLVVPIQAHGIVDAEASLL